MSDKKIIDLDGLKKFRQEYDKRLKDGTLVVSKSLTSEQLENVSDNSGDYQNTPFTRQATGTDGNKTKTSTAPIAKQLEIRGNSVVFWQMVESGTSTLTLTEGHKYITDIGGTRSLIASATSGQTLSVTGGTDQVFDLTLAEQNGRTYADISDGLTAIEQWNNDFPLPYYNGTSKPILLHTKHSKLINTGYNLFTGVDTDIPVLSGYVYRIMRWGGSGLVTINNTSNIEQYDENHNLLSTTVAFYLQTCKYYDSSYPNNVDRGIKITGNTRYIRITNNNESDLLVNLAWDGSRDNYEAHEEWGYELPQVDMYATGVDHFDSVSNKGIHTTHIEMVVLKDLEWELKNDAMSGVPYFQAPLSVDCGNTTYILCNLYVKALSGNIKFSSNDNIIALDTDIAYIRDTSCNDVNALLAKLENDDILLYPRANDTVEQISSFAENVYVDDFGQMYGESAFTGSASNPLCPLGFYFFYPADYAKFIDDIGQKSNWDKEEFVYTTGDQVISGVKTFSNYIAFTNNNTEIRLYNDDGKLRINRVGSYGIVFHPTYLAPNGNNRTDLGTNTDKWKDIYFAGNVIGNNYKDSAGTTRFLFSTSGSIYVNAHYLPSENNVKDLGSSLYTWKDIWVKNLKGATTMTQAQYDALVSGGTVDNDTFYFIEEE